MPGSSEFWFHWHFCD